MPQQNGARGQAAAVDELWGADAVRDRRGAEARAFVRKNHLQDTATSTNWAQLSALE
ncbi:MAG: hypothetical protein Q9M48_03210 [Rhodobacterales bacterium]|nr:hypothetical protein [Rhodobacterales bacterium]